MKYYAICLDDHEKIIPADKIVFRDALTGEIDHEIPTPEERYPQYAGDSAGFITKKACSDFISHNAPHWKYDGKR